MPKRSSATTLSRRTTTAASCCRGDPELPDLAQRAGSRLATAGIRAWRPRGHRGGDQPADALDHAPPRRRRRPERSCSASLGSRRGYAGEIEAGADTLEQAIETGSGPVELRARIELAHARLLGSREPQHRISSTSRRRRFRCSRRSRTIGLSGGRGGMSASPGGMGSRHEESRRASEQALVHYLRSAGLLRVPGSGSPHPCTTDRSATEAIARCNELSSRRRSA